MINIILLILTKYLFISFNYTNYITKSKNDYYQENIMEHNTDHTMHHHPHHHMEDDKSKKHSVHEKENTLKLVISATLHCLLGCGIGEVIGVILGTVFNLDMFTTMVIAIILGFVFGLFLGVLPLIRASFTFKNALKTVIIAEGLSIAVMEAFEVLTQVVIPGVMEAGLSEPIFWYGMIASLAVGFIAALPVNYVMIKKGVRHQH
jgi:F0F1-type ATP synthase assembly protein I